VDGLNFGNAQPVFSNVTLYLKNGPVLCTPIITWSDALIRCTSPAGNGTGLEARVFSNIQSASVFTYRYSVPAITLVVATSYPTIGGSTLTITGTSFDESGFITVNGTRCTVTSWTQSVSPALSQVMCTLPVGTGLHQPLVLSTVAGLSSTAYPITYDAPVIASMIPSSGLTQIGQSVTLVYVHTSSLVILFDVIPSVSLILCLFAVLQGY
jgi:hypothetical protein